MNRQGEKSIPFSGLDDKREIMMVLAVTIGEEIFTSSDSLPVKSCNTFKLFICLNFVMLGLCSFHIV